MCGGPDRFCNIINQTLAYESNPTETSESGLEVTGMTSWLWSRSRAGMFLRCPESSPHVVQYEYSRASSTALTVAPTRASRIEFLLLRRIGALAPKK